MMEVNLDINLGSLRCEDASIELRRRLPEHVLSTQIVAIDTEQKNPGFQAIEADGYFRNAQIVPIGNVPCRKVGTTPDLYGMKANDILHEHLTLDNLFKGGALVPTETKLAEQWHHETISSAIRRAIGRLVTPDNRVEHLHARVIWSPASTTGRGIAPGVLMTLKQILNENYAHIPHTVSAFILSTEGLTLDDKGKDREILEGTAWRELAYLQSGGYVDRRYEKTYPNWQGYVADFTYRVSAKSNRWQLQTLDELRAWLREFLPYSAHPAVGKVLHAHRVRHTQVRGVDKSQPPQHTFVSLPGAAIVTLRIDDAKKFATARLSQMVLRQLLGKKPAADIGRLTTQRALNLNALEGRLNFSNYSTQLTRQIARLSEDLQETPKKKWRPKIQMEIVKVEDLVQSANDETPELLEQISANLLQELLIELYDVATTRGVQIAIAHLENLFKQIQVLQNEINERLGTFMSVAQIRGNLISILPKDGILEMLLVNKNKLLKELEKEFRRFEEVFLFIFDHAILSFLRDLKRVAEKELNKATALAIELERAIQQEEESLQTLIPVEHCGSVIHLVEKREDFEEIVKPVLSEEQIQILKDEMTPQTSGQPNVLALAGQGCTQLRESLQNKVFAKGWLDQLNRVPFEEYLDRSYPTKEDKFQLANFLMERSTPLGGGEPYTGYEYEAHAVPPQRQYLILCPKSIRGPIATLLTQVDPSLSADAIIGVEHLPFIFASQEIHAIPPRAIPHLVQLDSLVPQDMRELSKYVTTRSALSYPSYVPFEFLREGWTNREILTLAWVLKVLEGDLSHLTYFDVELSNTVPFGSLGLAENELVVDSNLKREIKRQIEDRVSKKNWEDIQGLFEMALQAAPSETRQIRGVFKRLKPEYEKLQFNRKYCVDSVRL